METSKVLQFELLGVFSCKGTEEVTARNTALIGRTGKKMLSFLQYLIVNHARHISSDELIQQFWGTEKGSSDPANSLKNMIFKTRSLLKEMYPNQENLIVTLQGCYAWNPSIQVRLDVEEFEHACLNARKQSGNDYLDMLMEAIGLYRGDFLSGNDGDWTVPLRRYYQTLYLDVCKMVLPLLQKKERWIEMIGICEQAVSVDFSTDIFTIYQMQALISMGHPDLAVDAYEAFRKNLWTEFELEPAEQVEQMHMLAKGMCHNHLRDQDILKIVAEGGDFDNRAFMCTFAVFQSIVALERRHLARIGHSTSIVVVSLGDKDVPTTDARRLERILLEGLRAADPVARLDAGSYILMLAGASTEDANIVMGRIDRMFHKAYSHSKACITFRVSPLKEGGMKMKWENDLRPIKE